MDVAEAAAAASSSSSFTLSANDTSWLTAWSTNQLTCVKCAVVYREINNLGEWLCHQHVGALIDNVWTCCSQTQAPNGRRVRGCVRAHHKSTFGPYTSKDAPLAISSSLARHISDRLSRATLVHSSDVCARDATAVHANDYFVVRRFDAVGEQLVFATRAPLEDTFKKPHPFEGIPKKYWLFRT